ncbi:putative polyketide synthase [Burkholderia pseudomallei MSHR435]|nr:putative polyketide synthase [Burkholderia pseudomallei MSHR435]
MRLPRALTSRISSNRCAGTLAIAWFASNTIPQNTAPSMRPWRCRTASIARRICAASVASACA